MQIVKIWRLKFVDLAMYTHVRPCMHACTQSHKLNLQCHYLQLCGYCYIACMDEHLCTFTTSHSRSMAMQAP